MVRDMADVEYRANAQQEAPATGRGANARQMDGRPGEAWGCESGTNRLVMIQTVSAT
jgi:streptogramin lyase